MDGTNLRLTARGIAFVERSMELQFNGLTPAEAYAQTAREFGLPDEFDLADAEWAVRWRLAVPTPEARATARDTLDE